MARRPVIVISLFIVFSSVAACAPKQPAQPISIPPQHAKPRISISALELRIHDLINDERKKHGLSPLGWSTALSNIARKHSADMAKRNYFSHYTPEGHDFSYRYKAAGYSCAISVGRRIYGGAENIFQNNLYDRIVYVNGEAHYDWNSMERIAVTSVQGWMNSSGHRKNILTPHWRSEGIGVVIAPDDKIYITQNFC